MSQKIYRSALGKKVDMGSLMLKNENVRAVGNMGVNAKGDVIDKKNDIVTNRNTQVNNQYRKQIQNQIVDVPPLSHPIKEVQAQSSSVEVDEVIEGLDTDSVIDETTTTEPVEVVKEETSNESTVAKSPNKKKTGGLASAIAKAREVEQKKLQTPREELRSKKGVKKI